MKKTLLLVPIASLVLLLASCSKSSETFSAQPLEKWYPLTPGKYVTYALDSTVYTNFGTVLTVRSYQVKYVNDSLVNDALGRPGTRIIRYIRKTSAAPWLPDAAFFALKTNNSIEFIENNMRFIKLKEPVRDGYTWKGNAFIETSSLNSEIKYLDNWDYTYDSVNVPLTFGSFSLDSTLIVRQRDEVIGSPSDPNFYSEYNYGVEKYAKGIGMIYRRFFHNEYQPPVPGRGGHYTDGSYGVTFRMIDHN
ncbi:MAG: hypothetical protein ABIT96_05080 [Ferruginibacter sp.]